MKILIILLILFSLNACDLNGDVKTGGKVLFSNELKPRDLSIQDFVVETGITKRYGSTQYVATFTNNSKYPILYFQLDYEPKDSVTDDELSIFDDFIEEHYDWIDSDDRRGVILRANGDKLVETGKSIEKQYITVGYGKYSWYDSPTKSQFELMEPKELQVVLVDEDNTVYTCYYNYNDNEWTIDEETLEANTWPKGELKDSLIKPRCKYTILTSDKEDDTEISFYCYGIDKTSFDNYITEVQTAGFKLEDLDKSYSSYYDSYENDSYKLVVSADFDEEIVDIDFEKIETE